MRRRHGHRAVHADVQHHQADQVISSTNGGVVVPLRSHASTIDALVAEWLSEYSNASKRKQIAAAADRLSAVPLSPATAYAKTTNGLNIAYQIVGDGPMDLVFIPWWWSHV